MTARTITIPNFDFSGFYYPQILEALIVSKRALAPELTDESDFEPSMQMLRSFALSGHLSNTLIDVVANENTLPTAELAETIRDMLLLIDYRLKSALPGQADLVYRLSKVFTTAGNIVLPANARVATETDGDNPVVSYENLTAQTIGRTDQLGAVYAESSGSFVDFTTEANAGTSFVPLPTLAENDKIYFMHADVMWDEIDFDVDIAGSGYVGVWEFYDGSTEDATPDSVSNAGGGQLTFVVNGLLGQENRQGATVVVRSRLTGTSETVTTTWNGSNVATTTLLSQSSPSVDPADYSVGSEWTELGGVTDGTASGAATLSQSGDLAFPLPQTESLDWNKTTINGFEGFAVRLRVVTTSGALSPTLGRVRIDTGKQYVIARNATQGVTVAQDPLGSSNGEESQTFETNQDNFIDASEVVVVDAETWVRQTDFQDSQSQDKHYVVDLGEDDRATIKFGDGVRGKIPPIGSGNISVTYRYGAQDDGNVGARKLNVDKTGLSFVDSVFNPRQASGWAEAQSKSEESLEQAKLAGPASLRAREVAMGADDLESLSVRFVDSNGVSPYSRASAFEEGFGEKTVELVLVARGGIVPTAAQLAEIQEHWNGNKFSIPRKKKRFVANSEVVAVAFSKKLIDVTATVKAPDSVTSQAIVNRLSQVIQPEALKVDGVTFEWDFGTTIPVSRLIHEIFETSEEIVDVELTQPAIDVELNDRELPAIGVTSIVVVAP